MIRVSERMTKFMALLLCAAMFLGLFSVLNRKPVKAFTKNFMAYSPTQDDIEEAKRQRDEAREKAEHAAEVASELRDQQGELSGELAELKGLSDEQMAQYEQISEDYAAALIAKAAGPTCATCRRRPRTVLSLYCPRVAQWT